jgi:hypothetical protein
MSLIRRYTIHPPQLVGRLSPPGPSAELSDAIRQLISDYDAAMQELQRWLRYMADANDTGQEGAGIVGVVDGIIDHGEVAGLADDDHPQYLKEKASGGLAVEIPIHDHSGAAQAGVVDHGVLTGLTDNDHPLYQRKHGFDLSSAGAATQAISYDKTTRKVTVTPTGATFTFWIDGVQYTKTGAQVSGAHDTTTGLKYFYYDSAGALQVSTTPWSIRDRAVIPVALVYWSNTLSDGVCFYECHTADRWLEGHYNLHFSRGCQYISGYDLTGYTLTTDTDAGVTYAIGDGIIADEDIRFASSAVADGGPYVIFYRSGAAGEWLWTATDTFPFKNGGTYPQRNEYTGATWQLTEVGDAVGRYVNYFVCATTAVTPAGASAFLIPGQTDHASLSSARAESIQSLSLGTLPFEEITPIWRVTLLCRSTLGGTYNCRIEEIVSLKNQTVTVASSGGTAGVTDHGALTGLADDDHTQYQLRSEEGVASGYPSLDANVVVVQAVKLVRQGLVSALPALAEGELYWATDTDTLYIGT